MEQLAHILNCLRHILEDCLLNHPIIMQLEQIRLVFG